MGQIKLDLRHVKGDTFYRPSFASFSHNRLSFTGAIATFSLKRHNRSVDTINLTQSVDGNGNLLIGIDQEIDLPTGNYDWDIKLSFDNGEIHTYIGGIFTILPESPAVSRNVTTGINSYIITENNDTVSLAINDSPIPLPPKDGNYYALGWENNEIVWGHVATELGTGTVTSVDITGSEFTITGSPITDSGTINIVVNSINISKVSGLQTILNTIPSNTSDLVNDSGFITEINSNAVITALGFTPQNAATAFNGNYSSLIGIPSQFTPAAHTQAISTITGLQTALDSNNTNLTNHSSNTSNPHSVTKSQIGLGNVDNTSDLNKPISTATQSALDLKLEASSIANFETTTQLNIRDTNNRSRSNHTGTQDINSTTTGKLNRNRLNNQFVEKSFSGTLTTGTYELFTAPFSGTIVACTSARTSANTASINILINGVLVTGLDSIPATSNGLVSDDLATAANTFTKGNIVQVQVVSVSNPAPTFLSIQIEVQPS